MNSQISCCLPVSTCSSLRAGGRCPNVCSTVRLPLLPDVVKLRAPLFGKAARMRKLGPEAPVLEQDGHRFRDLNKNGRLDTYEDSRLPVEERVADLLGQMTLAEKVGLMFHQMTGMTPDGELVNKRSLRHRTIVGTTKLLGELLVNHVNLYSVSAPRQLARWSNNLQKAAERTRLGIPVTVSSDPRHSCRRTVVASMASDHFSAWPEPIGLGAADDPELTRAFADMARQEYVAAGIRTALHPMADLATER